MKDKDNREKKDKSLTQGEELFENIFREATLEIKREKAGKEQSTHFTAVSPPGRWQQQSTLPGTGTKIFKPRAEVLRKTEKAKAPLQEIAASVQESPQRSAGRTGSKPSAKSLPRAAVLFSLLIILAGILVYYLLGILDVRLLLDYFKTGHEGEVAQVSAPKKEPVGPSEKVTGPRSQPQEKNHNPATIQDQPKSPLPAPAESSSSISVKEDRFAETETPTTTGQARSGVEVLGGKTPSAITRDRPNVPEVAAKQESQPEGVPPGLSSKQDAPKIAPSRLSTPKYPYSAYLGSFKTADAVKKAMSEYQEKGLSPYWVKVDLGEKGVWFRFFAGHFQNKEEAEKFIRERNVQGATLGNTKYANLIGSYGSDQEIEDQRRALVTAGFYPYIIRSADGKSLLYSGAFDRKEYAEKERILLTSKGIKAETVER